MLMISVTAFATGGVREVGPLRHRVRRCRDAENRQ